MARRHSVALSDAELADLITCLDHGLAMGVGYGQPGQRGESLRAYRRARLLERLKQLEESDA